MQGFLILNSIIGGQVLASVSSHLNDTLGIVIIGLISLAVRSNLTLFVHSLKNHPLSSQVTFCGYRVIHL